MTLTPGDGYHLGIEVVPGTCPAQSGRRNAEWYDGFRGLGRLRALFFYPEP